jgi:DnaJ domain
MPYVIFGVFLLAGVLLLAHWYAKADPASVARALRVLAIVAGIAVAAVMIFSGNLQLAGVLASFVLPALLRGRLRGRWSTAGQTPHSTQKSEAETRFLRMKLDHETGLLDGLVLEGAFRGRRLSELKSPERLALLSEIRLADEASARLLEAYLERTDTAWRESDSARTGADRRQTVGAGSAMSREEACQILGVAADATPQAIKDAHRRLMLKLHPDQGGSTYLAAKLNEAKAKLLGD